MAKTWWTPMLGIGLALLMGSPQADAMTATITPVAKRDDEGNTTFTIEVCICMTGPEIASFNAAGGGNNGELKIQIPQDLQVTENDLLDDDELAIRICGGTAPHMVDPFRWYRNEGCPPGPPCCFELGVSFAEGEESVPSSDYGDENPGEFQLGQHGQQEGTVPADTTVEVTAGSYTSGPLTPTMPNRSS